MKKLFVALVALATLTNCFAQDEPAFKKGANIIGAGIGSPSVLGNAMKDAYDNVEASAPFQIFYERGVSDRFSIGAGLMFGNVKTSLSSFGGTSRTEYDLTFIAGKFSYYFVTKPKWSISTGAYLGYLGVNVKSNTGSLNGSALSSGLGYQVFVNGKYHFSKNFLAYGELGYGIAVVNLGVAGQF